ncbi:MAG: M16 family metallopeptidase [Candidatus Eutrophobiaceae bacterium]
MVASAIHAEVHEYHLDNGLQVLIKPNKRAPVVISQLWYKVGSSYEREGITGISHALEHMMFKGTEAYPLDAFSRIIAEHGGRQNAFTGRDYTAYFQTLEDKSLEISLKLEADRMRNLSLPPEEFEKEINVVREERRLRTDNNPQSWVTEMAMSTVYQTSAYRWPVIGWMNDLENMKVANLRQWYRLWYGPDNAVLVIVGNVEPEAAFRLVKKHFAAVPSIGAQSPRNHGDRLHSAFKRIKAKRPAHLPWLSMHYRVPSLSPQNAEDAQIVRDIFALETIAAILSGGNSARFPERLIRNKEIATSASANFGFTARLPVDVFSISATPTEKSSVKELELALRREIVDLQENLVSDAELQRVKAQVISEDIYAKDSLFFQALILGLLETMGIGWEFHDKYVDGVKATTAEQVREAARKYLVEEALTVAELVPVPPKEGERIAEGGGPYEHAR